MSKTLLVNALIILLIIIIFDVTTFNYLPSNYVMIFPEYRQNTPPKAHGLTRFPNGYFIEHEERGFDIGRNKSGLHWVSGITYPIWSNSFGCFDNEHAKYGEYIYFAGDSFTFGYIPFNQKFGTIIARTTDIPIFQCGVTHTGQQHQFEKLVQVVKEYGKVPKAIFVFYYSNDIENDDTHPHSTVIDGWLIDSVSLDEKNEIVRHTRQELKQHLKNKLDNIQKRKERADRPLSSAKRILKNYSLSVNIFDLAKDYIIKIAEISSSPSKIKSVDKTPQTFRNFYKLSKEKNGRYWYSDNPTAKKNKAALLNFSKFSTKNNAELIVVLIPPREQAINAKYYEELRNFLTENKIRYIDLSSRFKDKGLAAIDLYWIWDRHFNSTGNKVIAEILMKEFQYIFKQ